MNRIIEWNEKLDLFYKQHGIATFNYNLSLANNDFGRADLYYNRMQMIAEDIIKAQDELQKAWYDYKYEKEDGINE